MAAFLSAVGLCRDLCGQFELKQQTPPRTNPLPDYASEILALTASSKKRWVRYGAEDERGPTNTAIKQVCVSRLSCLSEWRVQSSCPLAER